MVRRRRVLLLLGLAGLVLVIWLVSLQFTESGEQDPVRLAPGGGPVDAAFDPFGFEPADAADLERRAAAGHAHPLFVDTPGGIVAGIDRTERFRDEIDAAVEGTEVDADMLAGLVLLESAGRPDAVAAGGDVDDAVGLTQILPDTAETLMGMRADVTASRRLGTEIAAAEADGDEAQADRLRVARARADQRFDPRAALAGTVRYLEIARERYGREDLAFVSYHMGFGNLDAVLEEYAGDELTPLPDLVARDDLSWARIFFTASPRDHTSAYARLLGLGDDSSTYLWRVGAAREMLALAADDRDELERLDENQEVASSSEQVLHPEDDTTVFADPEALESARGAGDVVPLPEGGPRLGVVASPDVDAEAAAIDAPPELYRQLRPEAAAILLWMGAQTRRLSGTTAPLVVTGAARDETYEDELAENGEVGLGYALHTTGFSFDVSRRYANPAQARAFQWALDHLQALNMIAWAREAGVIHITVSGEASAYEPLLAQAGYENVR